MCYHFKDDDTQEYIDWYVKTHHIKTYFHRGFKYYANGFDHGRCVVHKQGADHLAELNWGLIPHWVKSAEEAKKISVMTLNAKCETIFDLPSFRHTIFPQRCLIISSGFFEWRHIDAKTKIPYVIGVRDNVVGDQFTPFTFGGVYDKWVDKSTGEVHETFAIITTPANSMMEVIHNSKKRMPLIIDAANQEEWLTTADDRRIEDLMEPYPADRMLAHPISKLITSRGIDKNTPQVYEAAEYPQVQFEEFL